VTTDYTHANISRSIFLLQSVFCAIALVICALRIYCNRTYCFANCIGERTVAL